MKLSFLGGAREVGRSCILVQGMRNTLLDCGVKFGEKEEYPLLQREQASSLDKAVISHAHIDHSGYAPALFSMGFDKKVFLTKPTRDLMQLLLADYVKLSKEREGKPAFSEKNVSKLLQHSQMLEFGDEKGFGETGVRLHGAGHVLGSSMVELSEEKRVLYTGDLNLRETRLLEGAATSLSAQVLVMESTYGSRKDKHPSIKAASQAFAELIKKTLDNGGKVIIPTFAVGRGQEVLFTIESYMRSHAFPEVPIYLDGMVKKALRIYRHNAVYLKREVQLRILTSDDDPFKSEHYKVPETKDRKDVVEGGPCIILSTSGMLTGGPVLHYLKELGNDSNNSMILVGYQGEGTPGRALLDGAKEMEIDGQAYPIGLKVSQVPFSAHADHDQLVEFAKSVQGLEKVFVMHGERSKSDELAEDLEKQLNKSRKGVHERKAEAIVPELGSEHVV